MSALKNAGKLIVFVDETGHEELADRTFPVFGLGGCVSPSSLYEKNVKQPWLSLKATHFGSVSKPLHACKAREYSESQIEAIGQFFREQCFGRFAVVLKETTSFPKELFPYQVVVGLLEERLRHFAAASEFEGAVVIVESSKRTNNLAEKYISKIHLWNSQKRAMPINWRLMEKSSREPGLEVADFVVNAAGGRAKARAIGNNGRRKDFQSIFQAVGREFVSFVEIDKVNYKRRPHKLPLNLKDWTINVSSLKPAAI